MIFNDFERVPGPAAKYIKDEFKNMIHTSQVTLPSNMDYYNELGKDLIEKTLADVKLDKFKDTLTESFIGGYPSGRFVDSAGMWTDAYANRVARGVLVSTGHTVETSVIVIYRDN